MPKYKHCFIKIDGEYQEVPYSELMSGGKRSPKYKGRYFLPYGDCLMEVSKDEYKAEYKNRRRIKYLREEAILWGEVSYNSLDSDESRGEETVQDSTADLEDEAISYITISAALQNLTDDERKLIALLSYKEFTERECATKPALEVIPNAF